jgi:uncharacterized protein YfaP (DUF2135 family)
MKRFSFITLIIFIIAALLLTACEGVTILPIGNQDQASSSQDSGDKSSDSSEETQGGEAETGTKPGDTGSSSQGSSGESSQSNQGSSSAPGQPSSSSDVASAYNMGSLSIGSSASTNTISAEGDRWTFTATAGQSISISVTGQNGFDSVLQLYDPSLNMIISDDDSGPGLDPLINNYTLPSTGTYTIRVYGYGGQTGQYSISIVLGTSSGGYDDNAYDMGSISYGQTVSSVVIGAAGDAWHFNGSAGDVITISMTGTGSTSDTYLELHSSSGTTLVTDDDSGTGLSALISGYTLPSSGQYIIIARFYAGRTGSYSLTLTQGSSQNNNGSGCASGAYNMGSISIGQTVTSFTISSSGDAYTFSGTAGQTITISMVGTGSASDTYLTLYGPTCSELTHDDDSGSGLSAMISGYTLPTSGTYTIQARFYGGQTGSYSLSLSLGGSNNNTVGSCVPGAYNMGSISSGQTRSSVTISSTGDIYTFSGTAGQTVTISMVGTGSTTDTYLALYGPSCNELTHDDDSGTGLSAMISGYTLPSTGTYTIQARFYGGRTGTYSLSLTSGSSGTNTGGGCVSGAYNMGAITIGQTRTSFTISSYGDVYTFSGTAGQTVSISMVGTGSEDDTYLALYGPSCNELTHDDDSGTGMSALINSYTLPSSGTYTIQARFFGGATGSYSLALTSGGSSNPPSTTSPCSTGAYNMGSISMGQTVSSFTISSSGDAYTFSGTAGQTVTISMIGTGSRSDTYLALYGPTCSELTHDDDSGSGLSALISGYTLPSSGTYTIQARFYGGQTGSYSLSLSTGGSNNTNPGGTSCVSGAYNMGAISVGQTRTSFTISSYGDVYTFSGTAGQTVTISMVGTGSEDDTYLALYGPSCSQITYDDDSGTGMSSLISGYTLPSTGTYTIQARFFGGATGSYSLSLSSGGSSNPNPGTTQCVSGAFNMGSTSYGRTNSSWTISSAGDYYTFSGSAGDRVTISAVGTGSNTDTYLELYGPTCTRLTYDDDSGSGLSSLISYYTLPSSGTYTILIRFFGGATGDYSMTLTRN